MAGVEFTGEFFVPGKSGERIEADHMARYKFAEEYVSGKSVLDIACGVGYASQLLLDAGATAYTGVDIQAELIEYAREFYGAERAIFVVGDVGTFEQQERYGVITCFETIEHVSNYRSALRNLYRLLDHDGVLLISSPNRPVTSPKASMLSDRPANRYHTQEFTPAELAEELRLVGFYVKDDGLFGQRQRPANRISRKLASLLFGNPDETASPEVLPVSGMVPRYFVIRAKKAFLSQVDKGCTA